MSNRNLQDFIKEKTTNAIKLKGKHSPLSKKVKGKYQQLKIKWIYKIIEQEIRSFLIGAKNYDKKPKYRYFLAVVLANVSSDLLVKLAKDFALKNNIRLIQYSLYPKTHRINLLALKELKNREEYSQDLDILKSFKINFQNRLETIKNIGKI
ncbi:MAG: hypothetical protein ACQERB_17540 [Promethearchaeati archaeon]